MARERPPCSEAPDCAPTFGSVGSRSFIRVHSVRVHAHEWSNQLSADGAQTFALRDPELQLLEVPGQDELPAPDVRDDLRAQLAAELLEA